MGEGVGFGGSGRVPCRGADTVWSHGLSVELAGSLPAGVCLPAPVVGVKLGKDVLCTGGKSLIKVG